MKNKEIDLNLNTNLFYIIYNLGTHIFNVFKKGKNVTIFLIRLHERNIGIVKNNNN